MNGRTDKRTSEQATKWARVEKCALDWNYDTQTDNLFFGAFPLSHIHHAQGARYIFICHSIFVIFFFILFFFVFSACAAISFRYFALLTFHPTRMICRRAMRSNMYEKVNCSKVCAIKTIKTSTIIFFSNSTQLCSTGVRGVYTWC